MARNLGLIFYKDDDSGIAKINVTDTFTGEKLINNMLVDLFQKDQDADPGGKYEEFIFWVTLPYSDIDRYFWTVEHNGTFNPSAVGLNYDINYNGFILQEDEAPANAKKTIVLIDKVNNVEYNFEEEGVEYNIAEYRFEVQNEVTKKLYVSNSYIGNGVTTAFKVGSENLICYKFVRFSTDGGSTWKYPYDLSITWGSNSPNYDNETINSSGEFWVNFVDAPADQMSIKIDVLPVFDHARIELEINQPGDSNYTNYSLPISVTDYVAEFKK